MRKLTILRRPYADTMTRTGLGKYADSIEKCLGEEGIEYDSIPFDISLSEGYLNLLISGLIRPLKSALKMNSKDRIFHATDELCGLFFPLLRGRKILTIHHVIRNGEYRGRLYYSIWTLVTTIAIKSSDKVIAISAPTKKEIVEKFKVDPDKVTCVINQIDDIYCVSKDVKKEKVIGCLGMLIPRKNTSAAITAFKILADRPGMSEYCLEICGKGPEKDKLEAMSAEYGIGDRVRFISDLSDDEVVSFYNRSALIFNTSLHEGIGLVTLEAQRCGTPVLHLEAAEIPEEVTRFSISCKDEAEMAEMAYGLLCDDTKYGEVSRSSKEYADQFGRNSCRRYIDVVKGVK